MINFQNITAKISGRSILAQNASIDESNSLSPTYAVGYRGNLQTVPNGPIKNSISFDYLLEPSIDISYKLIDRIRNYDFNSFPTQISCAGKTGMGYLSSFSLSIAPNDLVSVSVQYDIFTELTGQLSEQSRSNFYTGNISGVGHYWSTIAKSNNGSQTGSILQANYSFQNNWQPIYKIGNPNPVQIKLISAQETFNFTSEYENIKASYSGQVYSGVFNNFDLIEINPLSSDWGVNGNSVRLFLGSGKITSNKINVQENNLILSETSIIKHY